MPLTVKSSVDNKAFARFTVRSFNSSTRTLLPWIPSFTLSLELFLLPKKLSFNLSDPTSNRAGFPSTRGTRLMVLFISPFRSRGKLCFPSFSLLSRISTLTSPFPTRNSFWPITVVFDRNQSNMAREDRVSFSVFLFLRISHSRLTDTYSRLTLDTSTLASTLMTTPSLTPRLTSTEATTLALLVAPPALVALLDTTDSDALLLARPVAATKMTSTALLPRRKTLTSLLVVEDRCLDVLTVPVEDLWPVTWQR